MNGASARGGGRLRGGARDVGVCTAPIQARLAHTRAARTRSCTSPLARLAPCTPAVSARTRHGDDQAREQGRLDAVEGGLLDRMRLHCLFAPVDVDQLGSAVDQICLICLNTTLMCAHVVKVSRKVSSLLLPVVKAAVNSEHGGWRPFSVRLQHMEAGVNTRARAHGHCITFTPYYNIAQGRVL